MTWIDEAQAIMADKTLWLTLNITQGRDSKWVYLRPVGIINTKVEMIDMAWGLAEPSQWWTETQWETARKNGIWKLVGDWAFIRADDLAVTEIAFCYHNPQTAGRELYRLRQEVKRWQEQQANAT